MIKKHLFLLFLLILPYIACFYFLFAVCARRIGGLASRVLSLREDGYPRPSVFSFCIRHAWRNGNAAPPGLR